LGKIAAGKGKKKENSPLDGKSKEGAVGFLKIDLGGPTLSSVDSDRAEFTTRRLTRVGQTEARPADILSLPSGPRNNGRGRKKAANKERQRQRSGASGTGSDRSR